MSDISLPWGEDVQADSTGDFVTVAGLAELEERVIRRFLNNTAIADTSGTVYGNADYIYDPQDYGGSARRYVDRKYTPQMGVQIQKTFLAQLQAEAEIASTPAPSIVVTKTNTGITVDAAATLENGQTLSLPQIEVTS